ncbi:MAG: 2Fe-2S iron-sulfur cluster binding domain-containing protein [Nocardiopsaceae bacterium]|nr:2Fe-2S iron-sulfur cluster binding domain-containing protein [Nocardiopsaceae bacterium]
MTPGDGAGPAVGTQAVTRLTYHGHDYDLRPGESVLAGLARQGVELPSACQAGACHTCLLRAESGDPGEDGRRGLKPTLAASGYFLACQARPVTDLRAAVAGPDVITPARVERRWWLGPRVLAVRVRPRQPVEFRPGQHVTLHRGNGIIRVYSIANRPGQARRDGLEFHVRVYPGGQMSEWLAGAAPGTGVGLGVPAGHCFYLPGQPAAPLLLAGTGTGIAPLLAIAADARAAGHRGPVTLLHGAAEPARLYLGEHTPPGLAGAGIRWRACVQSRGEDIAEAAADELAAQPDPAAARAYLCGGRGSVTRTKRALFLGGMSLASINADEFAPAAAS